MWKKRDEFVERGCVIFFLRRFTWQHYLGLLSCWIVSLFSSKGTHAFVNFVFLFFFFFEDQGVRVAAKGREVQMHPR